MPPSDSVRFLDSEMYALVLLTVLTIILVCEFRWPRRRESEPLPARWRTNFSLFFLNIGVVYLVFPVGALATSLFAKTSGIGLFNWLDIPYIAAFILSILLIDFVNYVQHYLMHHVPVLWRVHRAHHADPVCDVTTSLRFHPGEAMLGEAIELAVILACGAPPLAVACYRVARVGISTLVHGNIGLGHTLESLLRTVFITPDLHRVHHSCLEQESNSNLSGGFIWWDKLFGTYCAEPKAGHQGMQIGIDGYSSTHAASLLRIVADPFRPTTSD
jgi:sterol desaturase/sphingolipid hydroxylase (fatty acid hydroxylase superfamily)